MDRPSLTREEAFDIISGEIDYATGLWNEDTTESGGSHSPYEWAYFMEDYMDEMKKIASRKPEPECTELFMDMMRKVTAMGVRSMMQIGCPERKGISPTKLSEI